MSKIQMGRELNEQLLHCTDDSKSIKLMKELIVKQQQDIFQLDKMFTGLTLMFDKMCDTLANLATGTAALGAEVSPLLQESRSLTKTAKKSEELNQDD